MTQLDLNRCVYKLFQDADAELNAVYKSLAAMLGAKEQPLLAAAQRAWIDFRYKQCEFEDSRYEGGTMRPLVRAGCLESITRARIKDLRRLAEDRKR